MRFIKQYKKYTKRVFWAASVTQKGMMAKTIIYSIWPRGGGFDLFIGVFTESKRKICHVRKFESAKQIANLIEKG